MSWQDRWFHAKRRVLETVEDRWFDRTHHVHTSGDVPLQKAGIADTDRADSELYVPARPADIREALRDAHIQDAEQYTFIDFGSGKGRAIFVAAELPFRKLIAVEFSPTLHRQASQNVKTFRFRGQDGRGTDGNRIQALHVNAMEFAFPSGPLVVYLFNPFGAATMQVVLDHLAASLARDPRHVIVILLWPRCGDQVARMPGMGQICATRRHEIFEVNRHLQRDTTA